MAKAVSLGQNAVPRFSVVMPTYQRREVVSRSVRSLARQEFTGSFEVIVVVDGSNDGTAEALRSITVPFPLTILVQPNQGAASARNRGAWAAHGELLLFLDDDMEAHPRLLVEHERSHREGADVVLGHIPLHPESPPGILSINVGFWAESRLQRLSKPGAKLSLHDLLTGQLSVARSSFQHIQGFDASFTRGGSFGNEDLDFCYRLSLKDYKIAFNPLAISWQYYTVHPRQYLRQWHQAGLADVTFVRKHPDQIETIFAAKAQKRLYRYVWRPLLALPHLAVPLMAMLRRLILSLLDHGAHGLLVNRLFSEIRTAEYWRGVQKAGGIPQSKSLRVLSYHAIADLTAAPVVEPYGVSPSLFRNQLDMLLKAGFRFVDTEEFLRFLRSNGGLPRKALLLTFDDCYEDILNVALPVLEERGIPAVAFAVTGYLGGMNEWDRAKGAPPLRLLNAEGLRELAKRGIEIGAHSRTHRSLTQISTSELAEEIAGSVADIESLGIARPRLFAYPYGDYDDRTQKAVRQAGLQAALTVDHDVVRASQDPYRVPRIEVIKGDLGWKFRWKLALPNHSIAPWRELRFRPHKLRSC